jgi:hypothetical protein
MFLFPGALYIVLRSRRHTKEVIGRQSSVRVGLCQPKIQTLRPRIHNDDGTVSRDELRKVRYVPGPEFTILRIVYQLRKAKR